VRRAAALDRGFSQLEEWTSVGGKPVVSLDSWIKSQTTIRRSRRISVHQRPQSCVSHTFSDCAQKKEMVRCQWPHPPHGVDHSWDFLYRVSHHLLLAWRMREEAVRWSLILTSSTVTGGAADVADVVAIYSLFCCF
jgi:hypothetical protein